MKKNYVLILFLCLATLSKATIHLVAVYTPSFAPGTINAVCGDTVRWVLTAPGESHTTTSVSVPAGAAGWGANLNSTSISYEYKLTTAGTYSYICTYHVSMGMAGTITVTCPTGVAQDNDNFISYAYPNPFSNKLTIESQPADLIALYNLMGEKIKVISLAKGQYRSEISGIDLGSGVYFYAIIREGVTIETRKIIKK